MLKHISVLEFQFSMVLLTDGGWVMGIFLINDKGMLEEVVCSGVLLAMGGMGQLYRNIMNFEVAIGDGVVLVFCAGVEVSDMEFIQFHLMVLYLKKTPHFPLSKTLHNKKTY